MSDGKPVIDIGAVVSHKGMIWDGTTFNLTRMRLIVIARFYKPDLGWWLTCALENDPLGTYKDFSEDSVQLEARLL